MENKHKIKSLLEINIFGSNFKVPLECLVKYENQLSTHIFSLSVTLNQVIFIFTWKGLCEIVKYYQTRHG
jgi:hypothetical protein